MTTCDKNAFAQGRAEVPGSAVRSIRRGRRCESPSTRNATSAEAYTTCNAVLDGDECPEAGDHVEL